ncbi:FAD-dependent monooxygenase [Streptantibioticus silvisoli]|uniref:FAD-dependent monooxygenase n=1 Tax=Streptantibioticus silvisoli TaxID=2705255 RepID=A0ABT6W611_9ACTN|nr:FAD-dependent monooxygenase [Streptantibioticus silvisoli]MDI5965387.1 FAD-dependent monooxygenase [Streptantibioticus silvisoli]
MDADVIIVGAGPTGLMLAAELRLAGARPLVLERRPQSRDIAKANGLGGRVLDLLAHRGLLDRLEALGHPGRPPAPRYPFGTVHLDLTDVPEPPLRGMSLPQPQLERVLDERARELGAEIRRGHEVIGVRQDDAAVSAEVRGPQGSYRVAARFLVGCDGPRSRVRDLAGIPFPGTTYPEVNRLGHVTLADSVIQHDDGDLEVPGWGRIAAGFTRTERGVFAFGRRSVGDLMMQTTEAEPAEVDDSDAPMTLAEFQDSVRRVLGTPLPVADATRLSRYGFQARQADRYRHGRILLAGDAAHAFPATGVGLNVGMLDAVNLAWKLAADVHGWAPAGLLDTYHSERHYVGARTMMQTQAQVALRRGQDPAAEALRQVLQELLVDEQPARRLGALIAGADIRYPMPGADRHALTGAWVPDLGLRTDQGTTGVARLMRTARPVLLDLADRPDLRAIAGDWRDRVDIRTAEAADRPADALLIRPDAHIAWAATTDEPGDTAGPALRAALSHWFGAPLTATGPTNS